jgi:hypothetical protein
MLWVEFEHRMLDAYGITSHEVDIENMDRQRVIENVRQLGFGPKDSEKIVDIWKKPKETSSSSVVGSTMEQNHKISTDDVFVTDQKSD